MEENAVTARHRGKAEFPTEDFDTADPGVLIIKVSLDQLACIGHEYNKCYIVP